MLQMNRPKSSNIKGRHPKHPAGPQNMGRRGLQNRRRKNGRRHLRYMCGWCPNTMSHSFLWADSRALSTQSGVGAGVLPYLHS